MYTNPVALLFFRRCEPRPSIMQKSIHPFMSGVRISRSSKNKNKSSSSHACSGTGACVRKTFAYAFVRIAILPLGTAFACSCRAVGCRAGEALCNAHIQVSSAVRPYEVVSLLDVQQHSRGTVMPRSTRIDDIESSSSQESNLSSLLRII